MVYAKLLSNENGIVRYAYQPESDGKISAYHDDGIGEFGVLVYDKATSEMTIEKMAENDFASDFYRSPMHSMIFDNTDNLPKETTLMWY